MKKIRSLLSESGVFLLLIVVFHVVLNFIWHTINTAPPTWDSAGHLGLSFLFADRIPQLIFGDISFTNFLRISNYYPPLVQFLGSLFILVFGRVYDSAIFIGTIFLVLSIIYLYKIIMHYFQDERLAAFTVFIYSLLPHVWEQSRQFHLDVPLVAILLMAYYYLINSDALRNQKNSLLFFIFFTLAQLTKWYGFIFLIIPFIYEVFGKAIREKDIFNRQRIKLLIQGLLMVLIFAVPWYLANYNNIVNIVQITSTGEVGDPENVFSFESMFHYIKLIMSHQITFVSILLLVFSMYMFSKKQVTFRKYLFHLVAFPYIVFTLIQNKDLRYVLPLTPIFALYISYTLLKIELRFNAVIRAVFSTYLMFVFFFMSFNRFDRLPESLKPLSYIIGGPYYHGWYYEPHVYAANPYNWNGDEIIKEIQRLSKEEQLIKERYRVLELSDNRFYSLASFEMYRRQNGFEEMEIVVPYFQFDPFTPDELSEYLKEIHFALVPSDPGPTGLRNFAVLNQLVTYFSGDQNVDFSLVKLYDMPDGNTLSLYKRTNFIDYKAPYVKEDSLKISISEGVLFLDRSKTGGTNFKVSLFNSDGVERIIEVAGGGSQRRIGLEGFIRVRVDLPLDRQDVREVRGWFFEEGEFVRDPDYAQVVIDSGNEFIYEGLKIIPRVEYKTFNFNPKSLVRYTDEGIVVSIETPEGAGDKVFVAYAIDGWIWNNVWLEGENRFITIPLEGLLQLEISQQSQLLVGFPGDWGLFPCYDGRAVCFYPLVEGL